MVEVKKLLTLMEIVVEQLRFGRAYARTDWAQAVITAPPVSSSPKVGREISYGMMGY